MVELTREAEVTSDAELTRRAKLSRDVELRDPVALVLATDEKGIIGELNEDGELI